MKTFPHKGGIGAITEDEEKFCEHVNRFGQSKTTIVQ